MRTPAAPYCPDVGDGFLEEHNFNLTPEGKKMLETADGVFEVM
jgi:hypothetical protein